VRSRVHVKIAHDLLSVIDEEPLPRLWTVKSCVVSLPGSTLIDVSGVTLSALTDTLMVGVKSASPPDALTVRVPDPPTALAVQFRVNETELCALATGLIGVEVHDAIEPDVLMPNESSSILLLKILKDTEKGPPGTAPAEVVHGDIDSLMFEQVMRVLPRPFLIIIVARLS
jgi:hypothetical protein